MTDPSTSGAGPSGAGTSGAGSSPALVLDAVRKVYGGTGPDLDGGTIALDHADLAVAAGEIVALLGPSGSGKTTLLSIAGGLLTPTSGRVEVGGHDISEYSGKDLTEFRRTKVGFVFQSVNLVPFLTAEENLLVVSDVGGRRSAGRKEARRRARALLDEPALVLFDEPTSALDTKLGEQVMDLIQYEMRSRGTAAVIVTHDTRMTHVADRTVHITDGRLESSQLAET